MVKKYFSYWFIVSVILTGVLVFMATKLTKLNKINSQKSILTNSLKKELLFQSCYSNPSIALSDSAYIWDINGKKYLLSKRLSKHGPVLIYKIASNSCESCLNMMMKLIDRLNIHYDSTNLIIIIPDTLPRKLKIFKNKYNLMDVVYGMPSNIYLSSTGKRHFSFLFQSNKNLDMSLFFIPSYQFPDMAKQYLLLTKPE